MTTGPHAQYTITDATLIRLADIAATIATSGPMTKADLVKAILDLYRRELGLKAT